MILYVLGLIIGLLILFWSAERFVDGATKVSLYYKMSPLFVGMVVIGFGTSAPELIVSAAASFYGQADIALGNAYGSNIVNITLILGLTALIRPIKVKSTILKKEVLILLLVTVLSGLLLLDLKLSRFDSFILLGVFGIFFYFILKQSRIKSLDNFGIEVEKSFAIKEESIRASLFKLVTGLIVLIASSRLFSWSSIEIATALGISKQVIGLTVVAIGTSLPELISSVVAASKGESDLALGNIVGSNIFNTLAVVSLSGMINPLTVSKSILERDIVIMIITTILLFIFGIGLKGEGRINRVEGFILILVYFVYSTYLYITAI